MTGSLQLRDYPGDMVRLSCEKCGRSGQYRKQKLIERYGADMRLPDLREEIATVRASGQNARCLHGSLRRPYSEVGPPETGTRFSAMMRL